MPSLAPRFNLSPVMKATPTTTGAGNLSAVRDGGAEFDFDVFGGAFANVLDVKDAVFASHDYNQGPQTCLVHDIGEARLYHRAAQWEDLTHSMATILGQWLDEGRLADIANLKSKTSAILDKYESLEDWQS